MATYYVSKGTGNNSNDGLSPATAWRDLSMVFSSSTPVTGGDTVYVAPGHYMEGTITIASNPASSTITLIADTNNLYFEDVWPYKGDVVVGSSVFLTTSSSTGLAIHFNGRGNYHFIGFTFVGDRSTTFDSTTASILYFPTNGSSPYNVSFTDCLFVHMRLYTTSIPLAAVLLQVEEGQPLNVYFNRCVFMSFAYGNTAAICLNCPTSGTVSSSVYYGVSIKNCLFLCNASTTGPFVRLAFSTATSNYREFGGLIVENCTVNMASLINVSTTASTVSASSSNNPIVIKRCTQLNVNSQAWTTAGTATSGAVHAIGCGILRANASSVTSTELHGVSSLVPNRASLGNLSIPSNFRKSHNSTLGLYAAKLPAFMLLPSSLNNVHTDCQFRHSEGDVVVSEDAFSGTLSWTNISNATGWDGNYASCDGLTSSASSRWLKWTNFGFNIPSNAVITGVLIQVRGYGSTTEARIANARLVVNNTITGSNIATNVALGATAHISSGVSLGNMSTMGGVSLTPDDVNSPGFGVAIQCNSSVTTARTAYISAVRVVVYYRTSYGLDREEPDIFKNTVNSQFYLTDNGLQPVIGWPGCEQPADYGLPVKVNLSGDSEPRRVVLLRGFSSQLIYVPVTATATTISVEVRRNSSYSGSTLPGMRILSDLGISEQTVYSQGPHSTWETISIGPFTPSRQGTLTIILFSCDTSGDGEAYFDNFSVS